MKVLITGASGLIGSALCARLSAEGHTVIKAVRRPSTSPSVLSWDPAAGTIDAHKLEGIDAVVHLAGAGIGDKRWTPEYKQEIRDSRTKGTELIAQSIAAMSTPPSVLLSGSAIGIYGSRGDEILDETSSVADDFLAQVCVDWEKAAQPAVAAGIRTVFLRTGIVLSPKGGALKKQAPIFKLGLGGTFGSGRQWQSWISIDDEVGAIIHLLTSSVSGPVNLTAPNPVTSKEFTRTLGKVLKRPAFAKIPSFAPKALLGSELVQNLLLNGQRVTPSVLQKDGYEFVHPDLADALRDLLSRS
jgi:uncharacterized protein (TIGR01777 family)